MDRSQDSKPSVSFPVLGVETSSGNFDWQVSGEYNRLPEDAGYQIWHVTLNYRHAGDRITTITVPKLPTVRSDNHWYRVGMEDARSLTVSRLAEIVGSYPTASTAPWIPGKLAVDGVQYPCEECKLAGAIARVVDLASVAAALVTPMSQVNVALRLLDNLDSIAWMHREEL